ncbi:hypothetical protein ACIQ7N_07225 [Lysinibacillus sp. NPDC095746]|uniref:hypothetical protein n=1 Tax=Lysinibacillus sp. NPDC095746 TaxID=3364134 RepID=UPI0038063D8E
MMHKAESKRRTSIFKTAWFMWFWLIIFPPLGVFLIWKQGRLTKKKRTIATVIAGVYFVSPMIIGKATTLPLYNNQEEFIEAFNKAVKKLDFSYSLENTKKEEETITSKLGKDITLIENIDEKGAVHELIMVGQGEGMDIILSMGLLIGMTNPDLSQNDIGAVLKDLRLFDESYDYQKNETTVEKDTIRYNLKYDEAAGVIFSASKVK